jgi:hypothetical protein
MAFFFILQLATQGEGPCRKAADVGLVVGLETEVQFTDHAEKLGA